MAADDLSAPLGPDAKRKPVRLPNAFPMAVVGVLGLCIAVFVVWAAMVDDPLGGEPMVVSADIRGAAPSKGDGAGAPAANPATVEKVESQAAGEPAKRAPGAATPPAAHNAPAGMQTVTIIDGTSGKRQEITIAANEPSRSAPVDQRLLEATRHGAIPRVGLDGARASVAYARSAGVAAGNSNVARVAIVIGGLGIGAGGTADALANLPGAVTFAFAPYGADLDRLVSRARVDGHEVLLQIPMEPFDYPDNDPGPQTLLISLAPEQNIDRMHWLMSRFQGYVGVSNYMGARFTANEAALAPMLREVAKRGLLYLDDGSSPRSLASQIAGANQLPFAKANIVLDAVPTKAEIDNALARLEKAARESGVAVGVATALPVSINLIAQWAKNAESRGLLLVPISAAAVKPKSS